MLEEELKSINELIMLKHFLETEEKYEGQEREVKAIETVLNLITKLQKENEEKDKELEDLKEIKNIADSKITDLRKIKYYDKLQSEKWILQTKLKEKDKQIDLMARAFKQDDIRTVEEIKQYFETKAKKGE